MKIEDVNKVETSTVLWSDIVDSVDPNRQRENELHHIAYIFGGGRVQKRDGNGPYPPR